MNITEIRGNWNVLKEKLKREYGDRTDDDLIFAEVKEDELWGRLQKKIGRTSEEIIDEIKKI